MITIIWDDVLAEIQAGKPDQTTLLLAADKAQKSAKGNRAREIIANTVKAALVGDICYEVAIANLNAIAATPIRDTFPSQNPQDPSYIDLYS